MKIFTLLLLVACSSRPSTKATVYSDDFVKVEEHMRLKEELLTKNFSPRFQREGLIGDELIIIGKAEVTTEFGDVGASREVLIDRADKDGLLRLLDYGKLTWIRTVRWDGTYQSEVVATYSLKGLKGKYLTFVDFECVSKLIPGMDLQRQLHRECRTLHRIPINHWKPLNE